MKPSGRLMTCSELKSCMATLSQIRDTHTYLLDGWFGAAGNALTAFKKKKKSHSFIPVSFGMSVGSVTILLTPAISLQTHQVRRALSTWQEP